ncbi:hypothetical protein HDV05_007426 [Chytridiales sp. JEL 0842]|nr:hypothetical protein HDV05_007426 [Chytridiales sp. JEL 0842]
MLGRISTLGLPSGFGFVFGSSAAAGLGTGGGMWISVPETGAMTVTLCVEWVDVGGEASQSGDDDDRRRGNDENDGGGTANRSVVEEMEEDRLWNDFFGFFEKEEDEEEAYDDCRRRRMTRPMIPRATTKTQATRPRIKGVGGVLLVIGWITVDSPAGGGGMVAGGAVPGSGTMMGEFGDG